MRFQEHRPRHPLASLGGRLDAVLSQDPANRPAAELVTEVPHRPLEPRITPSSGSREPVFEQYALEAVEVPASVISVSMFADCDQNYCGQAAAYQLAHRLATGARKRAVAVYVSRETGKDFLDVYFVREPFAA